MLAELPPELSPALQSAVVSEPVVVRDPAGGVWMQIWISKTIPAGKAADEPRGADFPQIPQGAFVGVIHYAKPGGDYCGKPVPAGVYTMRFCLLPEDGAHQGVAPRRDFVLLAPAGADPEPAARPGYDALVALSRKASGTNHPSILFLAAPEPGAQFPGVEQRGNRRVVLVKSGATELGIMVVGKAEE